MSNLDWIVMLGTLFVIVAYGTWKTRKSKNINDYLLGDKQMKWWTIGLSVMATQASAITFLSTPGQAYHEGMGFVQFYFGLPLAMIVIAVVFIPLYYKLKVYTAYEFLENRFDLKTRLLTAFLFLIQRGMAAGITIYAPAIILSQILGWSLTFTNIFIGSLVIIYTVSGGTKAVSVTHKQQMAVIFVGLFIAFGFLIYYLPVPFTDALSVAGAMGKMDVINLEFDPRTKYNIWSGLIGGFFLQLSYFGTDQSQVQRYLSGSSIKQSRLGLMFNGLVKIPMQFFILLIGVLVFLFYQFNHAPVFFNQVSLEKVQKSEYADSLNILEQRYTENNLARQEYIKEFLSAKETGNEAAMSAASEQLQQSAAAGESIRDHVGRMIHTVDPADKTTNAGVPNDYDYVFITFVMKYLPVGIVGLLFAMIFSGAMSSTSAELNALASTTTVDVYKRNVRKSGSEKHYVVASKWFTFLFGIIAILFATLASLFENLIEAVNIIGSLFYGTILGIFLVAFFFKKVTANAVFIAALIAEAVIIAIYIMNNFGITDIAYLWFNLLGPALVIAISLLIEYFFLRREST